MLMLLQKYSSCSSFGHICFHEVRCSLCNPPARFFSSFLPVSTAHLSIVIFVDTKGKDAKDTSSDSL